MELPVSLHESFIQRGSILHAAIFEDIDHGKFFAVMGISGDKIAGFFFINSRIHPAILKRPAQLAMQYLLRQQDYTFLNYDSFLCATAILQIPIAEIAQSIAEGRTTHVGELTEKDLSTILDLCRSSELFSRSEKQKFFYP